MFINIFFTLQIPWGVTRRAYKTIPNGLRLSPSKIQGAGSGIRTDIFLPSYAFIGEYEGQIVPGALSHYVSPYAWMVNTF